MYEKLNRGDIVNKKDFAEKFGVSEKSIQRDIEDLRTYLFVPSQQRWTQKSFKKRNESQYFVNLLKPTAFIPRFA